MARNRTEPDLLDDDDYWSLVADFIDRRDRGEAIDPAECARGNRELEKRLRACVEGFGWLERALSSDDAPHSSVEPRVPDSIGDYRIIREIGRGGMGVVYEAVHDRLQRRVALKVLFDSSVQGTPARERFLREAKTAASLHHTNIIPVFDAGSADGHLYFAMQLIDGQSLEQLALGNSNTITHSSAISRSVERKGTAADASAEVPAGSTVTDDRSRPPALDPMEVARLGLQAADALAYAHARGVVHRDVKPSNLLLDHRGVLWVADFGLARRFGDTVVTLTGARLGTPRYMSPEQATAQWDALDARTDVYSLGVTLYELLAGQPIFRDSTPQQLIWQIIRNEPPRLKQLGRRIPRDLETIVLKAMAKRPADRYASAQAMADDLRRFLANEPVQARRIGPLGRLHRWCRREPMLAGVVSASVLLLSVVSGAYQVNLLSQRDSARQASHVALEQLASALFHQAQALCETQETGRRWRALDLLARSAKLQHRPELAVQAVRAIELHDVRPIEQFDELGGPVSAVAFGHGAKQLAIATSDASPCVTVWNERERRVDIRLTAPEPIQFLAFGPNGRWLAGATEQHICLWDLQTGQLRVLASGRSGLSSLSFTPDGLHLIGFSGGLHVWEVATARLERTLVEADVEMGLVVVSESMRSVIAAIATPQGGQLRLQRWSLGDYAPQPPLELGAVSPDPLASAIGVLALAVSSDGEWLAASSGDARIRVWNLRTGRASAWAGHRAPATSLAFRQGTSELVSTDGFEVKLWNVAAGGELATLIRPESGGGAIPVVAVGNGDRLATAGDVCQLWEIGGPSSYRLVAQTRGRVTLVEASPDERTIAWVHDRTLQLWDITTNQFHPPVSVTLQGDVVSLSFLPDGHSVVIVGIGETPVQIYDRTSGSLIAEWKGESATAVAARPDGRELAVAHSDNVIRLWNVSTGQIVAALAGHTGPVTSMAYSPDGKQLVAGCEDRSGTIADHRTLHIWELPSGRYRSGITAHRTVTFDVAFSPDGKQLASCGGDRTVKLWDVASMKLAASLTGHVQAVRSVAFSADGTRVASSSLDGRVRVWHRESARLMADLRLRASGSASGVAFGGSDWLIAGGGPYGWLDAGPGGVEAWNLPHMKRELASFELAWDDMRPSSEEKGVDAR